MANLQIINALGKAVASHHFCGSFDGVAAVLYEVEGHTLGTHWAAMVEADGTVHQLPISSEDAARDAYHALVRGVHQTQAKQDAAIRADATRRGRAAYEESRAVLPNYANGTPRPEWEDLDDVARWSWERQPRA